MSEDTEVMIGGIAHRISGHEVMAVMDGKLDDQIKREVMQACPHIRGPVARIQFLTQSGNDADDMLSPQVAKEVKQLMKSVKVELKTMSQAFDAVETKLERLMADSQAKDLIELMTKEG